MSRDGVPRISRQRFGEGLPPAQGTGNSGCEDCGAGNDLCVFKESSAGLEPVTRSRMVGTRREDQEGTRATEPRLSLHSE